jgi:hypothetical protein
MPGIRGKWVPCWVNVWACAGKCCHCAGLMWLWLSVRRVCCRGAGFMWLRVCQMHCRGAGLMFDALPEWVAALLGWNLRVCRGVLPGCRVNALCLPESRLKCAGRLPGTVGDPSLGPGRALAQWWTESFFTFFHYLVSFWHNLHTISGLKSPFWASQIRCAQDHPYMGSIQPITTPVSPHLDVLVTPKHGDSSHPSDLH